MSLNIKIFKQQLKWCYLTLPSPLWCTSNFFQLLSPGYLCSSIAEQRSKVGIYKRDDMVSKPAVCEAVEAFLSRSQADLGQALPLHVEESLGDLQDHLLDVCQCWIPKLFVVFIFVDEFINLWIFGNADLHTIVTLCFVIFNVNTKTKFLQMFSDLRNFFFF